jgi:hypothetical protein
MLPSPKPTLLSFFQRHLNVKAASARPRPALVPTSSLADYFFSYELREVSGKLEVAWAGQAHFLSQRHADIILPLDAEIVERILNEEAKSCETDLHLTIYITKTRTSEIVMLYDGAKERGGEAGHFESFAFVPSISGHRTEFRNSCQISTEVMAIEDTPTLCLQAGIYANWDYFHLTQTDFLSDLEQGFVFSRCL